MNLRLQRLLLIGSLCAGLGCGGPRIQRMTADGNGAPNLALAPTPAETGLAMRMGRAPLPGAFLGYQLGESAEYQVFQFDDQSSFLDDGYSYGGVSRQSITVRSGVIVH